MGINRNLKRNPKWVVAQLVVRFSPSPLQAADAICFKGTPNLLCICSGKPVWVGELTVQPPSEQAHKHKASAPIYPTNSEVWSSVPLLLEFTFLIHILAGMNGLCQEPRCFQPVFTWNGERETHRAQEAEHLNSWTTYIKRCGVPKLTCVAKMITTVRPGLTYNIASQDGSLTWTNLTSQETSTDHKLCYRCF